MAATMQQIGVLIRGMAWERAKGALREFVAARGCLPWTSEESHQKFNKLSERVEAFIKEMEDNGWHE